jgi:PAS domain S-box-containing protein
MARNSETQNRSANPPERAELRRRAEAQLRKQPADRDILCVVPEEARRLLHELEVHQIELEMQNEELRRAQREIEASRAKYVDLFDFAPVGYLTLSETGIVLEANLTAANLLGVEKSQLVKKPVTHFIVKEDQDIYYWHRQQLYETRARQVCELRMMGKSGVPFWVNLEAIAGQDMDDAPVCRVVMSDITERKRAEESLRDASLYTRSLIEASLDPLVTISADGKIMDANAATEVITGVPRDELIGNDFSDYFSEPERARQGYRQVFREGFVRDYPLAIRHSSGKLTDVLYNATVYRNEAGTVQGVFAAARDITERKRAEEQLRNKENQLRFFASQYLTAQEKERRRIAAELHDSIASALAGIKFRIEKTAEEMKRGQSNIESIKDLSSNLSQAIGEVRRIMTDLRPSILDDLGILPALGWFCREFEKTYSHLAIQKQIGISEDDVPELLKTVIFRISQEAMSNIARHSKASLVDLALQKAGGRVELTIQDNGRGFRPDEIVKGLGLSTMRERAELSGGIFEIHSAPGRGTVIRASWPIAL